MDENKKNISRRNLLESGMRGACLLALGGVAGFTLGNSLRSESVWQLDPYKCVACGNCATYCVRKESAVKCVHSYPMCGYCELCTGFFDPDPRALHTGAENQLCPTGAIVRTFVEDPYFEYTIDEKLCIGCGKCVKGCKAFGNGSLYLQVRHDLCKNCNECSIAVACPAGAYARVPAYRPYLLKGMDRSG
jgi:electron transport complex protein RnfB